jgi:hypothetical protein
MANRPLYNGSARAIADNNPVGEATRVSFNFRASVGAIDTGVETVGNATFEAEAGQAIVLNYDIRKYGGGVELDTPTTAVIRIFPDDDSNDVRTGAVFESSDLIGGNALPRSGTVSFTPATAGTFRVQLEMQQGNGNFGATADDWRIISDGSFQRGGLSSVTRAVAQDKGRLRAGLQVTAHTVKTQADADPASGVFAFTMNAAGTASEESVRVTWTLSHDSNKTSATETYRTSARRSGTSTIDTFNATSRISASQHRAERKVSLLNYPTAASQLYDSVLTVENDSALHANNTRQYDGLGGQSASGKWTYFTVASAPLNRSDFRTVEKASSYTTNTGGSVENIFCDRADEYTEDANKVPSGTENEEFIATDTNMTVKSGRVLNARGEPLRGVFVVTTVRHESSGVQRDQWGTDSASTKTLANGWQDDAHVVTVSTPPSGTHSVEAVAYFPAGTSGSPASREFYASRMEQGTPNPGEVHKGKKWPAAASFSIAHVALFEVVHGGAACNFTVRVFDKESPVAADTTPTCRIVKAHGNYAAPFATPVLTPRAGQTGVYEGSFTPDAVAAGARVAYEIFVTATVRGFTRVYWNDLMALAHDVAVPPKDKADPVSLLDAGRPSVK